MIKFFRKIRQNLLMENKTEKYFKYAIGEIVLVVIGILIALQVSNWNKLRVEQNIMNAYYTKLVTTLKTDIKEQNITNDKLNLYLGNLMRCLDILNTKNEDDIEEFKAKIGAINIPFANDYSMELFDEFMNKGYLSKIEDPKLKSQFERLKIELKRGGNWDELLDSDYVNNVSPFIQNYLNYTDFSLQSDLFKLNVRPKGGPKVDYSKLFDNLKVWNAIYGRLIFFKKTLNYNIGMLEALTELKKSLSKKG
jgi:hypothetical protein